MCFHLAWIYQSHHTTAVRVHNLSDTWRLTLTLPSCSPRLVSPRPVLHPRLPSLACTDQHQLMVTVSALGVRHNFYLGLGMP
jgi:hypothetical protein